MASASLEGITIKIGADVSDLKKEMAETTTAISGVGTAAKTDIAAAETPVKNLKTQFKDTALNAARVAAACLVIGKALGGFVKGAVEDAVKTDPDAAAALESMKTSFNEMKASLGEALLPIIKEVAPVITDLLNNITTFIKEHPNIAMGIMAIVAVAAIGLIVFSALAPVFALAGVAIGAIATPIIIVVVVIAALIAAGIALYANWDSISAWFQETWDNIKTKVTTSIDDMKLKIDEWKNKVNSAKANLISFKDSVVDKFSGIKTSIVDAISGIDLIQVGKDFVNSIKDGIQAGIDSIRDTVQGWFLSLIPDWAKGWLGIGGGGDSGAGGGTSVGNPTDVFRAGGGPVSAGSPYIIGEAGPELFVPQTNGYVVPNEELSGYGTTINVNLGNVYGESYLRDYVISAVTGAIRQEVRLGL